ncbi:MAG: hypothetical protein ACWA49_03075 [Ruegeria sp.]
MDETLGPASPVTDRETVPQTQNRPCLVSLLTTGDPQTQLMCLVLTLQARQQGSDVFVLLCGPAGDLALNDAPEAATAPQKPNGMSPQAMLRKIQDFGGKVEVCALYMPNRGITQDALLPGILPASPSQVAARILAPDTRQITF